MKTLTNTYEIWEDEECGFAEVIMNRPGEKARSIAFFKTYELAADYVRSLIK